MPASADACRGTRDPRGPRADRRSASRTPTAGSAGAWSPRWRRGRSCRRSTRSAPRTCVERTRARRARTARRRRRAARLGPCRSPSPPPRRCRRFSRPPRPARPRSSARPKRRPSASAAPRARPSRRRRPACSSSSRSCGRTSTGSRRGSRRSLPATRRRRRRRRRPSPRPRRRRARRRALARAAEADEDADVEGARLIALNMALNGEPREATDKYLAENFDLGDRRRCSTRSTRASRGSDPRTLAAVLLACLVAAVPAAYAKRHKRLRAFASAPGSSATPRAISPRRRGFPEQTCSPTSPRRSLDERRRGALAPGPTRAGLLDDEHPGGRRRRARPRQDRRQDAFTSRATPCTRLRAGRAEDRRDRPSWMATAGS